MNILGIVFSPIIISHPGIQSYGPMPHHFRYVMALCFSLMLIAILLKPCFWIYGKVFSKRLNEDTEFDWVIGLMTLSLAIMIVWIIFELLCFQ